MQRLLAKLLEIASAGREASMMQLTTPMWATSPPQWLHADIPVLARALIRSEAEQGGKGKEKEKEDI